MNNETNFKSFIKDAAAHFNNYELCQLVTHTDRYIGTSQVFSGYVAHKYTFFGTTLNKDEVIAALENNNIVQSDTINVTWGTHNPFDVLSIEIVVGN